MNMNPWKDQIDVINGFDFIRKIEGSVLFEQVCICVSFFAFISYQKFKIHKISYLKQFEKWSSYIFEIWFFQAIYDHLNIRRFTAHNQNVQTPLTWGRNTTNASVPRISLNFVDPNNILKFLRESRLKNLVQYKTICKIFKYFYNNIKHFDILFYVFYYQIICNILTQREKHKN